MITPEKFLKMMDKEEEDIFKLGYIESDTEVGKAKVKFDGESTASGKNYLTVNYEPVIGDRVLLVYVKGTYLILGNIGQGLQLRGEVNDNRENIKTTNLDLKNTNESLEEANKSITNTNKSVKENKEVVNTMLGVDENEL